MTPFIAVVDDHPAVRRVLLAILHHAGYAAEEYVDGRDFLDRYRPRPGCVLLNQTMPGLDGIATLRRMRARGWAVPVIGTSALLGAVAPMLMAGARGFLLKPFGMHEVLNEVRALVKEPPADRGRHPVTQPACR